MNIYKRNLTCLIIISILICISVFSILMLRISLIATLLNSIVILILIVVMFKFNIKYYFEYPINNFTIKRYLNGSTIYLPEKDLIFFINKNKKYYNELNKIEAIQLIYYMDKTKKIIKYEVNPFAYYILE